MYGIKCVAPVEAMAFLEPIKEKVKNSAVATISITTVFAELNLTLQNNDAAQVLYAFLYNISRK